MAHLLPLGYTGAATAKVAFNTIAAPIRTWSSRPVFRRCRPARARFTRCWSSGGKFLYRKQTGITGAVRRHVHRPPVMLENMFRDAGFTIASRRKLPDMDLKTFASCAAAAQWILKPSRVSRSL
ncbi:MAG: hypothetical protein GKR94_20335 [Gammaproteobacteria bacterium]|nr:hypothetical protein [Gammaproteobacteria bacterium]